MYPRLLGEAGFIALGCDCFRLKAVLRTVPVEGATAGLPSSARGVTAKLPNTPPASRRSQLRRASTISIQFVKILKSVCTKILKFKLCNSFKTARFQNLGSMVAVDCQAFEHWIVLLDA